MEQFEKNIKEKLNERKIQPSPQAWDKLEMLLNEQEVKTKKKSPRTYLFIAASLLAFVSLGTFFFKMNSDNIQPSEIQIQPNESLAVEENQNEEIHEVLEEETIPSKGISESKIIKTKSENKTVVHHPKKENVQFNESEIKINQKFIKVDNHQQEIAQVNQEEKQEISTSKVDPKKLLIVVEYERNVEKSASQFKQMKNKFEEVKTALNNINQ
ncbi:hypothetical protein [Flavobacterium sp. I3-2]|uniref:hypothetical protein n=1 Tax=Flavobacterium sp. I3-2 TaxID=2748319 RepID=UPI0015AEB0CB|nr:hypothetical protein [Flavobacterium sp. I3-2]